MWVLDISRNIWMGWSLGMDICHFFYGCYISSYSIRLLVCFCACIGGTSASISASLDRMFDGHHRLERDIWPELSGMMKKYAYDQTLIISYFWWLAGCFDVLLYMLICTCYAVLYISCLCWSVCISWMVWEGLTWLSCICLICLLIHMNIKGWYFFLWKKRTSV